jgi:hypothetical protein
MAQRHSITVDQAGEIDLAWFNSGSSPDALRLVHARHYSTLTVPSMNGAAPLYQYRSHNPDTGVHGPAFYHLSGPTLADWQAQQEHAEASREARDLYEFASGR